MTEKSQPPSHGCRSGQQGVTGEVSEEGGEEQTHRKGLGNGRVDPLT